MCSEGRRGGEGDEISEPRHGGLGWKLLVLIFYLFPYVVVVEGWYFLCWIMDLRED